MAIYPPNDLDYFGTCIMDIAKRDFGEPVEIYFDPRGDWTGSAKPKFHFKNPETETAVRLKVDDLELYLITKAIDRYRIIKKTIPLEYLFYDV